MRLASHPQTFNFREILSYFLLASLAASGLLLLSTLFAFATLQTELTHVGPLTDFPPQAEPYRLQNNNVAPFWLVNLGPEIRAFKPTSPDATHCTFTWLAVNQRFEDPCSGSKFALDGQYLYGPAFRSLDQYLVTLIEGQVHVDLSQVIPGNQITSINLITETTCGELVYYARSTR